MGLGISAIESPTPVPAALRADSIEFALYPGCPDRRLGKVSMRSMRRLTVALVLATALLTCERPLPRKPGQPVSPRTEMMSARVLRPEVARELALRRPIITSWTL